MSKEEKKLLKVGEVCKLTGISESKLRLYDKKGVLCPSVRDPSNGYRYYTEEDVEKLRNVLLLRRLGMGLEDIRNYLSSSDVQKAIAKQAEVLDQQREEKENLVGFARAMKLTGLRPEQLASFRDKPTEEGIQEAIPVFNTTNVKKVAGRLNIRSSESVKQLVEVLFVMSLLKRLDPHEELVLDLTAQLRECIGCLLPTSLYLFGNLGKCFSEKGSFSKGLDKAFGKGTSAFIARAIETYCETVQEVPTQEDSLLAE